MASHNDFGAAAEQCAAELLESRGWTIIARNWRWQQKEIDLIARREAVVAFVEVRARRSVERGHPFETIGRRKRRDLSLAARAWIAANGRPSDQYRFDAIAVLDPSGSASAASLIEHLEAAWHQ